MQEETRLARNERARKKYARESTAPKRVKHVGCIDCNDEDVTHFRMLKDRRLSSYCQPCEARNAKQWRIDNKQKVRDFRKATIERDRAKKHGLTLTQLRDMTEKQNGLCMICGNPPNKGRKLHIDHDHATGLVRGLLCQYCNHMLGQAKDKPEILREAANYLEQCNKLVLKRKIS